MLKNLGKLVVGLLAAFSLSGCGVYQLNQRTNPTKVSMNSQNTQGEFERKLALKYTAEIQELLSRLTPGTDYDKGVAPSGDRYSIGFFTPNHSIQTAPLNSDEPIYFGSAIISGSIYNRNRTTFAERASTVFVNHAKDYLSAALSASGAEMQNDTRVRGLFVSLTWGLNDRIDDFSAMTATYGEALKICADWASTQKFVNNQISAQEFADGVIVIGFYNGKELGKIKIDTQKLL